MGETQNWSFSGAKHHKKYNKLYKQSIEKIRAESLEKFSEHSEFRIQKTIDRAKTKIQNIHLNGKVEPDFHFEIRGTTRSPQERLNTKHKEMSNTYTSLNSEIYNHSRRNR